MAESKPKSFRFSPETYTLIEALKQKIGVNVTATAIIEEAVKELAKKKRIKLAETEK